MGASSRARLEIVDMRVLMKSWRTRLQGIRYRIGQFAHGFAARVSDADLAVARRRLSPDGFALFTALPTDAQRHSLNVLATLEQSGAVDADLAVAALLHDVGKLAADAVGAPIRIWTRSALVLAGSIAPDQLRRFARREPQRGPRFAAWVYREHPTIGAFWALEAGCTQRAGLLIALHQTHVPAEAGDDSFGRQLRALQRADNLN